MNLLRVTGRLVVPSVLLAATLPASSFAVAAAPMCQGQEATIVGTPGQHRLSGTEEGDVIVTNGAEITQGRGGNDLICVTGPDSTVWDDVVGAGVGDDTVEVEAARSASVLVALGQGNDTFVGGPGHDLIYGNAPRAGVAEVPDTERDVIDTGGGDDSVVVGSNGVAWDDEVRLGDGDDGLRVEGVSWAATAVADGGPGRDVLVPITGAAQAPDEGYGTWSFDNAAGVSSRDGAQRMRWTSMDGGVIFDSWRSEGTAYVGGDAGERVSGRDLTSVRLGDGSDQLTLTGSRATEVDGGEGRNAITLRARKGVRVDLVANTVEYVDSGFSNFTLTGFQEVSALARKVTLLGDQWANRFAAFACQARIVGAKGDDAYGPFVGDVEDQIPCFTGRHRFLGGPGADRARGNLGPDVFSGGPGHDVLRGLRGSDRLFGGGGEDRLVGGDGRRDSAVGGAGRDVCRAEARVSCERR